MDNEDSRSSIVIIEAGAGWPVWIAEYQRRAPNATVVAQTASEGHADFQVRVLHRLDEMGRGSNVLSVAVVLCAENAHDGVRAARERVCEALALALDGGDLVLAATDDAEPFKQELFALAGRLCESPHASRVNVRVRFSSSESGTMPSVMAVAHPPSTRRVAGIE
ncbi:MAG TPA: hypothetical protein VNN72_07465 [Polyangiaceae bacterium]|nr:hypothetical protein [Polyangiaceae bacterium]